MEHHKSYISGVCNYVPRRHIVVTPAECLSRYRCECLLRQIQNLVNTVVRCTPDLQPHAKKGYGGSLCKVIQIKGADQNEIKGAFDV